MRIRLFVAAAAMALAAPAIAADFSFTGSLPNPGSVQFFDFEVGAASNVTLRTWSYAGGVNAAGTTIARGGFDPILSVFDLPSGTLIGNNDDGGCALVAADSVSGRCWDTFFQASLGAGTYRVSVSVYPNFPTGGAFDPFTGADTFDDVSGAPDNPRSARWAFDILNVNGATANPIPEPASWAMLIAGFGLVGAMRRRQVAVAA